MEGPDQVLAQRMVDSDLAADRAVDLGHQRGGYVHEAHATEVGGGGKPNQVADYTAADRDDHDRIDRPGR